MDFGRAWVRWAALVGVAAAGAGIAAFESAEQSPAGFDVPETAQVAPEVTPAPRLPRGPAQLPAGVRVIPEPQGFVAQEDILAGELEVPSGRLVVDDYFYAAEGQASLEVPPGRHPVRIAVGRSVDGPGGGTALATVVTGEVEPVAWREAGGMGTDGGLGGFASAEAAEAMAADDLEQQPLHERQLRLLEAAGTDGVAEIPLGEDLDLFSFSIGLGDGGYGLYAGTDASGDVTRVVLDGGLLHLDWPRAVGTG